MVTNFWGHYELHYFFGMTIDFAHVLLSWMLAFHSSARD